MDYIEVDCKVTPGGENIEILVAYLAEIGFTMFEESEEGVKAYITSDLFSKEGFDHVIENFSIPGVHVQSQVQTIPYVNWNETWESNFKPVRVGEEIYVRAEYHEPDPVVKYELVIQPRMAFGTGHHATTFLMMKTMTGLKFDNKKVLDMGCGTGILGILASKMGAGSVLGIDNDPNAVENAQVNAERNGVENIQFLTGDANSLDATRYDIVLANINRNIILEDLPFYERSMAENGTLLLSGFYTHDLQVIRERAENVGLNYVDSDSLDQWVCAMFVNKGNKYKI